MNRNLFVCHSQVQLILAVGLAKGRFLNDENQLILFQDFELSFEMKGVLREVFTNTLYRIGSYPAVNKSWRAKLNRYPDDIKSIKGFLSVPFNKVFVICDDAIPEIYILKRVSKVNPSVELIWLEDGSHPYFVNTILHSGLNSNYFTRSLRKIIFKYLLGLGKYYNAEGNSMGSNSNLTTAYLSFVGNEREIFKSKKVKSISDSEYRKGIKALFSNNLPSSIENNSVILVLDKLDVYQDLKQIKNLITHISNIINQKGVKLYYKLHPREEDFIDELRATESLNKNIAIEYYYSANLNKDITIIGIKSTGLQASKKLGFKTISLAKLADEQNADLVRFYQDINIHQPNSVDELTEILT